jgi:hypothetical protein
MPPAIPTASSRAGIMTAMVASIIIAVAMIVVAIYTGQKLNESDRTLAELRDRDKPFLAEQDISDPRVQALNQAKQDVPAYAGLQSAMQVSLAESDQLSKLVGGSAATPDKAVTVGQTALKAAADKVKKAANVTLPADSLTGALAALSDQVVQLAGREQEAKATTDALQKQNQQILAAQKQQLDDKDKLIAAANQKVEQSQMELKQAQEQTANAQAALQASANSSMKQLQQVNASLTSQNQAKDKQLLTDTKTIAGLKTKLKTARVNPNEAIVMHPDGNIIRIGDNQTCFINLGSRQHVTKGLTFEVYDKTRGIPALGDGLADAGQPIGKASIEVFNIGPDTSECRIIKTQQGQQLVIGDLISNLIYDPTTSYDFVVYGNFDLSNSGVPSPGDADIVKRLITQWGGKLQDKPNVDTDFVIMGVEPVVPPITDPNNANDVLKHNEKQKELEKYQSFINAASQLSIPIMNQNRFLYFIGYYDLATR